MDAMTGYCDTCGSRSMSPVLSLFGAGMICVPCGLNECQHLGKYIGEHRARNKESSRTPLTIVN